MANLRILHLLNIAGILWRRRWHALATFILVCGGICAYALSLPNTYLSEASILIEPAATPKDYVRPSDDFTPEEQTTTFLQLIQSRSFIERLIQEFRIGGFGTDEKFIMSEVVRDVRKNIGVIVTSPNTFTISYHAGDPQFAQAFTMRIVDTLIRSSNSIRKRRAIEADQFFEEQLRQTEQALGALEEQITRFKTSDPTPAQEQALMPISREHAALSQQYTDLYNKKFQAQLTATLETNRDRDTYRIIDEANLPEKPASPNRVKLMLIGLGAGLMLGIGVASARELLDNANSQ